MSSQADFAEKFRSLHVKYNPVILFNIWDPGSAKAVEAAGAKAIATGSAPVAMAHGYADGENIPLEYVLDNLRRIVEAVDLPVTLDLEGGYGAAPEIVAENIAKAVDAGAIGFNFEDQIIGGEGLYGIDIQTSRVSAAREACDKKGISCFLNARTDLFLKAKPEVHSEAMLDDALRRATAYKKSGADGFFAPGIADEKLIARLCAEAPLPVNIIALPHVPGVKKLASLGAARISYGPVPYRRMVQWLQDEANRAFSQL